MIEIIIPGNPLPCKRPKFSTRGGFMRTYDPQKNEKSNLQSFITHEASKILHFKPLGGPIALVVSFHMPIPKSSSTSDLNRVLWGLDAHIHKPDLDNLIKLILDCCNEILWVDDRQIVNLTIGKNYSLIPCTKIRIFPTTKPMDENITKILEIFSPSELNEFQRLIQDIYSGISSFPPSEHDSDINDFRKDAAISLLALSKKFGPHLKKLAKI